MRCVKPLLIAVMVCGAAVAQDAPADATSALQEQEKKWEDLKSFRAEYSSVMPAAQGQGGSANVHAVGQLEMLRVKDVMKYRLDQKVSVLDSQGNAESTNRTITLYDGERTYVMTDVAGSKSVMVLSAENEASRIPLDAQSLLARLRELGDVRVAANGDVQGMPTYVFEGAPLLPNGLPEVNEATTMQVHLDKATGVPVHWVIQDAHGAMIAEGRYTKLEVNPKLDPAQFKFEVPVGATVIDMNQAGQNEPASP